GFCAKKPGRPRSYLRSSVLIRVHLRLVVLPAFDTIPSRPSGNAASKSRVVPNGTPNKATNFGRRLSRRGSHSPHLLPAPTGFRIRRCVPRYRPVPPVRPPARGEP